MAEELLVVFRTPDNPKAEDVLRNYLIAADTSIPAGPGPGADQPAKRSS
jgi:hypothetical protein